MNEVKKVQLNLKRLDRRFYFRNLYSYLLGSIYQKKFKKSASTSFGRIKHIKKVFSLSTKIFKYLFFDHHVVIC